jgi:hypothetical protein
LHTRKDRGGNFGGSFVLKEKHGHFENNPASSLFEG